MAEQPYRYRKKLLKVGHSNYVLIPASWLAKRTEKLKKKIVKFLDTIIYDKYIIIKPSK